MSEETEIQILQCPIHTDFFALAIEENGCCTRITPGKCCGRWDTVRSWRLNKIDTTALVDAIDEKKNSS